jgi:hypothetical protein
MFSALKKLFSSGRERDRRREDREQVSDATVGIMSQTYAVKNWSATGFLAGPCDLALDEGQEVSISFSVPLDQGRLEFRCQALVVKASPETRELSAMFVMLDREARDKIDRHFEVFPMG